MNTIEQVVESNLRSNFPVAAKSGDGVVEFTFERKLTKKDRREIRAIIKRSSDEEGESREVKVRYPAPDRITLTYMHTYSEFIAIMKREGITSQRQYDEWRRTLP